MNEHKHFRENEERVAAIRDDGRRQSECEVGRACGLHGDARLFSLASSSVASAELGRPLEYDEKQKSL